jgi:hypothetical protein
MGPSFSFAISASIGFEHEIAGNDDADGEPRPDRQRRRDVELAANDLLSGLADTVARALTQSADSLALFAGGARLCADAEQFESAAALNSSPQ